MNSKHPHILELCQGFHIRWEIIYSQLYVGWVDTAPGPQRTTSGVTGVLCGCGLCHSSALHGLRLQFSQKRLVVMSTAKVELEGLVNINRTSLWNYCLYVYFVVHYLLYVNPDKCLWSHGNLLEILVAIQSCWKAVALLETTFWKCIFD